MYAKKAKKPDADRINSKTLDELKAYARSKGYSEGWAIKVYYARQRRGA